MPAEDRKRYWVNKFCRFPAFLRFSPVDGIEPQPPADVPEIRGSLIRHVPHKGLPKDIDHQAVFVAMLAWLLSVYKREPNVCMIVQHDRIEDGRIRSVKFPIIREVNQEQTLDDSASSWRREIDEARAHAEAGVRRIRSHLTAADYHLAGLIGQVYLRWVDADSRHDDIHLQANSQTLDCPLHIYVVCGRKDQTLSVKYKTQLVSREITEGLMEKYQRIFRVFAQIRHERLRDIELVFECEKSRLREWNQTARSYNLNRPYYWYLSRHADRSGERIAVRFDQSQLSYAELERRSNILASRLRARGHQSGDCIGQYAERSLEMIIGMIAINKLGGIFVPIDPNAAPGRIGTIIADSGVRTLLAGRTALKKLSPLLARGDAINPADVLVIDELLADADSGGEFSARYNAFDNAYLIYTSGSTGEPKGVLVSHRALINHNFFCREVYGLTENDAVLQIASTGFDHSLEEILPALISGATVCLYPDHRGLSIEQLNEVLIENRITVFMPTTALWKLWAARMVKDGRIRFEDLRVCAIGGEKCPKPLLKAWLDLCGDRIELQAGYGVTEATITSTMWQYDPERADFDLAEEVPIGKPMANSELYILDQYLRRVPIGASGELYIGGVGVAEGYWNKEEETNERFIPNPFSSSPGRIYRTGDIVKYLSNGNLAYLSRDDDQLKIDGYRIELDEVESAIKNIEGVSDCAVAVNESRGKKYLAAFVKGDATDIPAAELRHRLPSYAIPQRIIPLDQFPLNVNGKIDRDRLRELARKQMGAKRAGRADAKTRRGGEKSKREIRKVVGDIWQQVLRVDKLDAEGDFFDIGGSSLLAIILIEKLADAFPGRINIGAFVKSPTLASTVDAIIRNARSYDNDAVVI